LTDQLHQEKVRSFSLQNFGFVAKVSQMVHQHRNKNLRDSCFHVDKIRDENQRNEELARYIQTERESLLRMVEQLSSFSQGVAMKTIESEDM
jgi:hypothetical protein